MLNICDHALAAKSFWHDALHITDDDVFAFAAEKNVLDGSNVNLLVAEQELLLWYYPLIPCVNFLAAINDAN